MGGRVGAALGSVDTIEKSARAGGAAANKAKMARAACMRKGTSILWVKDEGAAREREIVPRNDRKGFWGLMARVERLERTICWVFMACSPA